MTRTVEFGIFMPVASNGFLFSKHAPHYHPTFDQHRRIEPVLRFRPLDADQQHAPAAVDVGELAVERRDNGRGEQVGGHHPGEVLDVRIGAPDGRERRRDDRLIERGQEHRQHQADEYAANGGMIEPHGQRRRGSHGKSPGFCYRPGARAQQSSPR